MPDLQEAIQTWVTVYGTGPFYVNEHVAYDDCAPNGTPAMWDHSAGFGQWGALPVELQQTHDLRPAELVHPFTAEGRAAVNHVGVTAQDPAAESARLESLGFGSACTPASARVSSSGTTRQRRSATASRSLLRDRASTPSSTWWRTGRATGMDATRFAASGERSLVMVSWAEEGVMLLR
jgi:Glyoxalase/Bleomycin resistance protein/Dioxygenase superfamily